MKRFRGGLLLIGLTSLAPTPAERPKSPDLGLVFDFAPNAPAAAEQQALTEVRATGVNLFSLSLSWAAAEPAEGKYSISELVRAARTLRQSGATLHLDLPIVAGRVRDVPADLDQVPFDDPRLSARLTHLLAALEPALLDISTLSFGVGADNYFADRKEQVPAFKKLTDGAAGLLKQRVPSLLVGVTTVAPTESGAPQLVAALHEGNAVRFYAYAPFQRGSPYVHRPPDAIDHDWKLMLERSGGQPIAFPEVSYSSSPENGSNAERQADFVRHLRRFLASADGRRLLFARYATWRDPPGVSPGSDATPAGRRRAAFYSHRGLQTPEGKPKPAWSEWVKAGR